MSALESRLGRLEQSKASGETIIIWWDSQQHDEEVRQAEEKAKTTGVQLIVFKTIYEERPLP